MSRRESSSRGSRSSIGGNGPKVTWRLAARFADELNLDALTPSQVAEALPVIRERCAEIGRDPATLAVSVHIWGEAGAVAPGPERRQRFRDYADAGASPGDRPGVRGGAGSRRARFRRRGWAGGRAALTTLGRSGCPAQCSVVPRMPRAIRKPSVGPVERSLGQHVARELDRRFQMDTQSRARLVAALSVALGVAACSGGSTPSAQSGGGSPSAGGTVAGASAASGSSDASSGGANGFEGTLTTSGLYSATWTVIQGMEANPFNASANPTLTSDKGAFGNVAVKPDGAVSFGSAAPEFGHDIAFVGTGAKVTLDSTGQFVCAFTVDTDLKASSGTTLHLSGGMTVHWHPLGNADPSCP